MSTRYYEFHLPVFKQGDDLSHHLEKSDTPAAALLAMAAQYELAAAMCRQMASIAAEVPIDIDADTHHIGVSGPREQLDRLLEGDDALLSICPFDEDEDDEADEGVSVE